MARLLKNGFDDDSARSALVTIVKTLPTLKLVPAGGLTAKEKAMRPAPSSLGARYGVSGCRLIHYATEELSPTEEPRRLDASS